MNAAKLALLLISPLLLEAFIATSGYGQGRQAKQLRRYVVSVNDLQKAFDDNPNSAEVKYATAMIQLTAVIKEIGKPDKGSMRIEFETELGTNPVLIEFAAFKFTATFGLKKGDKVTVLGRGIEFTKWKEIVIADMERIRKGDPSEWPVEEPAKPAKKPARDAAPQKPLTDEEQATTKLGLATSLLDASRAAKAKGQKDEAGRLRNLAKERLAEIAKAFPTTAGAKKARTLLEELDK